MTTAAPAPEATELAGWSPAWEDEVYGRGRHLNRYPHHAVVGFMMRHYGMRSERGEVRVCELGCGTGNNLWFAAREGFTVFGIDGAATAIEYARRRFAREHLNGEFAVGDFARLPWTSASMDVVLDRGALAHAPLHTIEAALAEAQRVLKPGGRMLSVNLYAPEHAGRSFGQHLGENTYGRFSGGYFAGVGHVHFAPRDEVEALFSRRFAVRRLVHTLERDVVSGEIVDAFWRVECEKPA